MASRRPSRPTPRRGPIQPSFRVTTTRRSPHRSSWREPPLALNPSRPLRPAGSPMSAGATIGRVRNATYQFYRWRYESAFLVNLGLAGLFACLTGFGALIKIYLPWTPVPITGQVFFVLASAVVLGKHYGGLSQILYAFVGILGVPWFAGSNTSPEPIFAGLPGPYRGIGGFALLTGATFGYILGFIAAAFLIGWALDARVRYRRPAYLALLLVAGIGLVYLLGAI